jgi:SNF2 family DNA or RNA helicase
VKRLHKILGPHMLRRLKEDVEKSLPKKEEVLVEMNLSAAQKTYYKAVLEREG